MKVPPITASDPVVFCGEALCLRVGDALVPLRVGQDPVTAFVPGWRPTFAYTGFVPFFILHFVNEAGQVAFWIVDENGTRLGGSLGEVEADARDALKQAAVPVLRHLVTVVLEQPAPALDGEARAFLSLTEDLRRDIAQACAGLTLPQPCRARLDAKPDEWNDSWCLGRTHVEALLSVPFQDRLLATARDGMLSWPSPVDGRPLAVQGSLCSDDFRFAYRLADLAHGMVCYPIVSDQHAITIALYVPSLNLVMLRDDWSANWFDLYIPSLAEWLVPLICRFGNLLEGYLLQGANRVAAILRGWPATHLGHQLWNELAGIDHFLRLAHGPFTPDWIVPGPRTELWGPIEEIFPKLENHVDRSAPNSDFAIYNSYEAGICLVRITSMYVTAELRARLHRSVQADPVSREVQQQIASRRQPTAPIILIGLRVENRTLVNLLDFCEELVEFIADAFPGATIVLDGHNSGGEGQIIVSHRELIARRPPLSIERQVSAHLKRLQVGRNVTVVDTLGASVRTSLAWCEHATCFISVWGASLAKYRWACNKPGYVLTSNWNLLHRADLHIYHSPDIMETPTDLVFADPKIVKDIKDDMLLVNVDPGQPSFFNFEIDSSQAFSEFLKVVRRCLDRTTS